MNRKVRPKLKKIKSITHSSNDITKSIIKLDLQFCNKKIRKSIAKLNQQINKKETMLQKQQYKRNAL